MRGTSNLSEPSRRSSDISCPAFRGELTDRSRATSRLTPAATTGTVVTRARWRCSRRYRCCGRCRSSDRGSRRAARELALQALYQVDLLGDVQQDARGLALFWEHFDPEADPEVREFARAL